MIPVVLETWAFWTGIVTVVSTALAALSGCFARWFSSRVSALKEERRLHFDEESARASAETVSSLEWSEEWTGKATVGFTEDARSRFEIESAVAWARVWLAEACT